MDGLEVQLSTWAGGALQALHQLQQRGGLCDINLADSHGTTVPVHSCLIAASSPTLQDWLLSKDPSVTTLQLSLPHPNILTSVIHFMYTGILRSCCPYEAMEEIADFLQMPLLKSLYHTLQDSNEKHNDQIIVIKNEEPMETSDSFSQSSEYLTNEADDIQYNVSQLTDKGTIEVKHTPSDDISDVVVVSKHDQVIVSDSDIYASDIPLGENILRVTMLPENDTEESDNEDNKDISRSELGDIVLQENLPLLSSESGSTALTLSGSIPEGEQVEGVLPIRDTVAADEQSGACKITSTQKAQDITNLKNETEENDTSALSSSEAAELVASLAAGLEQMNDINAGPKNQTMEQISHMNRDQENQTKQFIEKSNILITDDDIISNQLNAGVENQTKQFIQKSHFIITEDDIISNQINLINTGPENGTKQLIEKSNIIITEHDVISNEMNRTNARLENQTEQLIEKSNIIITEEDIISNRHPNIHVKVVNRPEDLNVGHNHNEAVIKNQPVTEVLVLNELPVRVTDSLPNNVDDAALSAPDESLSAILSREPQGEAERNLQGAVIKELSLAISEQARQEKEARMHSLKGGKMFCGACNKVFQSKASLQYHMMTHTGERPFKCEICKKAFRAKKHLEYHMGRHKGDKPHFCTVCKRRFATKAEEEEHALSHFIITEKEDGVIPGVTDETSYMPFRCHYCYVGFPTEAECQEHVNSHDRVKPYSCRFCDKVYKARPHRDNHELRHKNVKYPCDFCGREFLSKRGCQDHQRTHTGELPFTCPECKQPFQTMNQLRRHASVHLPPGKQNQTCQYCGKVFLSKKGHEEHERTHTGKKPIGCKVCGKQFATHNQCKRHAVEHDPPLEQSEGNEENIIEIESKHLEDLANESALSLFTCRFCSEGFTSQNELIEHKKTHPKDRPFPCSKCGKSFKQVGHRDEHELIHASIKLTCPECKKTFHSKKGLKVHMLKHTGEKLYECQECEKKYYSLQAVRAHQLANHLKPEPDAEKDVGNVKEEEKFSCVFCVSEFDTQEQLDEHVRSHDIDRPYTCHQCKKGFKLRTHRDEHEQIHKNLQFQCEICGRQYRSKKGLMCHIRMHSRETPYECSACDKEFETLQRLQAHQMTHLEAIPDDSVEDGLDTAVIEGAVEHVPRASAYRKYPCGTCGDSYSRLWEYKAHMKMHGQNAHTCLICSDEFSSVADLQNHLKSHSNAAFTCTICSKSFKLKTELDKHARTHEHSFVSQLTYRVTRSGLEISSEGNECDVCHKKFNDAAFKLHLQSACVKKAKKKSIKKDKKKSTRTVSMPKKKDLHECPECSKVFLWKAQLSIHMAIHTEEKNYSCEQCEKKFKTSIAMKQHLRIHNGTLPHTCGDCGRQFRIRRDLDNHLANHVRNRARVLCDLCGGAFIGERDLKRHHQRKHALYEPNNTAEDMELQNAIVEIQLE